MVGWLCVLKKTTEQDAYFKRDFKQEKVTDHSFNDPLFELFLQKIDLLHS